MIVDRLHAELVWDKLARGHFKEAPLETVRVAGLSFKKLYLPRDKEFRPDVYLNTGLSFYAWPRLAGYRHRFVLVPGENLVGQERWEMCTRDVVDWIRWSEHMQHLVTFSTLKSGASYPFGFHAQSFPVRRKIDRKYLTALRVAKVAIRVRRKTMPHFKEIQIGKLQDDYPVKALRIVGANSPEGRLQAAQKVFELALNYDGLKAFNVVVVPNGNRAPAVYFFPRRKDGRATFGESRWQIAGLEMNGVLQAKTPKEFRELDRRRIKELFAHISPTDEEWDECLTLLETF